MMKDDKCWIMSCGVAKRVPPIFYHVFIINDDKMMQYDYDKGRQ